MIVLVKIPIKHIMKNKKEYIIKWYKPNEINSVSFGNILDVILLETLSQSLSIIFF